MNFQQPQAFWLLLFLIVPILIHLFQFRRYKKLKFSNVAFLKEVSESKKQQRNLKHLLILISRLLFITAFVCCLAKPNLPNKAKKQSPQVILFDNTPSMLSISEGKEMSVYEAMLKDINTLHEAYPATQFTLLDALGKPFDFFKDPGVLSSQSNLDLKTVLKDHEGSTILLASDFQQQSITENADILNDSAYQFILLPAYREAPETLIWDSIWVSEGKGNGTEILNLQLLKRGTNNSMSNVNALLNDSPIGSIQLDFEQSQRQTASFSLPEINTTQSRLTFQTDDLSYYDNNFYSTYEQDSLLKVLYLFQKEKDPLVYNIFSEEKVFEIESKLSANFSYQSLSNYNMAVVEIDGDFNQIKAESLRIFVENGGTLVLAPKSGFDQIGSLKALGFTDVIYKPNNFEVPLQTPDYNNPFFRGVFKEKKEGLDMAKVKPIISTNLGAPILQTVAGRPFLTRLQKKGSVFLFTALIEEGSKPFIKSPLFLPIFYKIAFTDEEQGKIRYNYLDEDVIGLDYLKIPVGTLVKLKNKSETFIPDQRVGNSGLQIILPKNELAPGYWQLMNAKTDERYGEIAFNYPKAESEAASYSAKELQAIFKNQSNVSVLENMEFDTLADYMNETKSDIPLWKYFLILALLCLFAEVAIIRFVK